MATSRPVQDFVLLAEHCREAAARERRRARFSQQSVECLRRVPVGNTNFEIGVHIAAALPEVTWLKYSFLSYNHLLATPIEFCDGYALVPDRPGHGLRLADAARTEFARPC